MITLRSKPDGTWLAYLMGYTVLAAIVVGLVWLLKVIWYLV